MAEIDSLEISIQSNADKANKSLDVLIGKLGVMAKGISAISSGKGISEFLEEVEKISSSMADVSNSTKKMTDGIKTAVDSASGSMKQVEKSVNGVKKRLGDTLKEISERTSGITPKLDMGNLDKEMSKYEKQLRDAGNLLNRILESSTADKQTAGIERLIIKINEAKNAMKEIERIQNEASTVSTPEVSIPIHTDEAKMSIEDIVDELDELFLAVRQNSDYKPFSAIQHSLDELKSKFPEATEEIKFFESELDKVYTEEYSGRTYKGLTEIPEELKQNGNAVEELEKRLNGVKDEASELSQVLANIHPLEFKGDNFFEMEKWVDDLTNKLNSLLDRQEKMSALGTKMDSKPMQSMAYDIEQLTKTLDVYEEKLKEARTRGELYIKIPNIDAPIDKIVGKTKVLRDSVSDIKVNLSSTSLKQVERQIENIKKKYEEIVASIERGAANKDFFGATPEFKRKTAELSAMRQKYQDLMQIQKELSLSGQTTESGKEKEKSQANNFKTVTNTITKATKDLEKAFFNVKKHIDNLIHSITRLVNNGFKKMASGVKSAVSSIKKFTGAIAKTIKENKKSSKSFDFSFKTILKYAFGIRSIFVLVNRLRSATKEGINNLVKYSSEFNHSISIITSAFGELKNGFASAFAPIINIVAPYIERFTNMMVDATNAIARFFAALTGKGVVVQAKKYYQDYAESLGGVADEAKKAGKALHTLGIDELNILSETKEDKNELLPEDMFETVKVAGEAAEWAKKLRDAFLNQDWEGLGRIIAELINKGLEWLYRKIKQITPKIEKALKNLAKVLNSVIANVDWDLLGRTIGAGINLLTKAFNALFGDDGINLELLGEKLSTGLRGMIDEVDWQELGNAIGNYLMIAWRIAYGFIEDMWRIDPNTMLTGWAEAGNAIGDTLVGIFERLDFEKISAVITEGLKGALETITYALNRFSENLDWIVDKINLGLDRLYDGLKWDSTAGENMGQKITAFTEAVSTAFNKLLDLDFGKVGQIIGAGITDIVRAFNQLTDIDTGGMDFEKLGTKLSDGLRKLVTEVPWEEFGNALGNGFMVSWRILDGFLTDMAKKSGAGLTGWQELGNGIADTINGLFDKFDLGKIASVISRLVNGIFETIRQAVDNIRWDDIADNLANGLNGLIDGIEWEENGKALNALIENLLGMLLRAAEKVRWEELGRQIGTFLSQIDWGKHLATVAKIIMEVLGGLLEGLGETPAGKFVAGFIKAMLGLKFASLFAPIASKIASALGMLFEQKAISNAVQKGMERALAGTGAAGAGEAAAASGGITGVISKIASVIKTIGGIGAVISGAVIAIKNFFDMMKDGFSWADEAFMALGIAIAGVGAVLLGVPAAIAAAVAGIVAAVATGVVLIKEHWQEIGEFFSGLWSGIKETAVSAWNSIKETLLSVWEGIKENTQTAWNTILEFLNNAWSQIAELVSSIWGGIQEFFGGLWNGIQETAQTVWAFISEFLSTTWQFISETAKEIWGNIREIFANVWNGVQETAEKVWNTIRDFLKGAWEGIFNTAKEIWNGIKEFFDGLWKNIQETAQKMWESIRNFLSETWKSISDTAREIWNGIGDFIKTVWDGISEIFHNVWDEIKGFLKEIWNSIRQNAEEIWNKVKDFFKNLWRGIQENAKSVWTDIRNTLVNLWQETREKAESIWNGIKDFFMSAWDGFKEKSAGTWSDIKNSLFEVWNNIKSTAENVWGNIRGFFEGIWDGVDIGIGESFKKAVEGIKNIWNSFAGWLNDKLKFEIPPINILGKEIFGGATIDLGKIPTFSVGGFPEDGLFMANHTELVGQFSNGRTAVANNEQIIAGIEEAAYRGFLRAQAETSPYLADIAENTRRTAEKDMSVSIGDRDVYDSYNRGADRYGHNFRAVPT